LISADISIPTVTKVYFEKNSQPFNENLEFTVEGYGYETGLPGSENYTENKLPGTYTPEVVFSFSGKYSHSGDEIYETYYQNYRHIDYYELTAKTSDGKTFKIKNIKSILAGCESDIYYSQRKCELRFNLDESEGEVTPQKIGFWKNVGCFFKKLFGKSC